MVKVILKPIDNDHKPVELCEGKTILGRGPLLGCSDKKVSRNHAVLEINAEGEIFLTPTHVNPCFYRTKSDTSPKMMKKDKALRLEPGDIFSLLPLTFQYQILLPPDLKPKESVATTTTTAAEVSKEETLSEKPEKTPKDKEAASKEEEKVVPPTTPAIQKDTPETGPSENGRPDPEEDDIEMLEDEDDEEEEEEEVEKPESPKPKRKANTSLPAARLPVVAGSAKKRGAAPPASQEQAQPRKKRTLPNWLIKSASLQQAKTEDNNGEALQKEDRGKRKGRKGQSEGSNTSRSARQNRQTIQRISLEDFVVSEEDWNSEDSAETGVAKSGGGRGTGAKRGRRRLQMDDSSGSDWETEHKNQGRGVGRGAAKDASSGSDWETGASSRRSSRRGVGRRRVQAGSESGSDWETDRRKKTPIVKKPRGRRSRKKSEDDDEDLEDEGNVSDVPSVKVEKAASAPAADPSPPTPSPAPAPAPTPVAAPAPSTPAVKNEPPVNMGRKSCQFGRKCYRKNAAHLQSVSHPGDSDYESPTEDSKEAKEDKKAAGKKEKQEDKGDNSSAADQKPECPYGTDCYRKNAQHRKDFLHTKKVRPKREASKGAAKRGRKAKDDQDDIEDDDVPYDLTDDESNDYKPDESVEK